MSQEFVGPLTVTSTQGVQGGSLELGATLGAALETPYVDFHFGLGAAQDFNVRLLNTADNRLDVVTALGGTVLSIQGDKIGIGTTTPGVKLVVNEPAGGAELRVDGLNGTVGLSLGADAAQPWVGTRTNHALRLLTNNREQVRVTASGNVGIGSTAPRRRLDVLGEIVATNRLTLAQDDTRAKMTWHLDNTTDRFRIFNQPNIDTNGTEWLSIDQGGNVSIYSTGFNTLTVGAGANGALKVRHINGKHWQTDTEDGLFLNWGIGQPVVVGGNGRPSDLLVTGNVNVNGGAVIEGQVGMRNTLGTLGYAPTPYHNGWGGGIRTWDVEAHGTIWSQAGYIQGNQDIAENYASAMGLEPGDVVCLDPEQDAVILSARSNDRLLLGVVSTTPAMLLNSEVEDCTVFPVALCGRVPCKVTDEGGPIRRGDLLTSSSTTGSAMKARPIRLGDQAVYAPGTILGKALGSLESGCGMIDIFVALS